MYIAAIINYASILKLLLASKAIFYSILTVLNQNKKQLHTSGRTNHNKAKQHNQPMKIRGKYTFLH